MTAEKNRGRRIGQQVLEGIGTITPPRGPRMHMAWIGNNVAYQMERFYDFLKLTPEEKSVLIAELGSMRLPSVILTDVSSTESGARGLLPQVITRVGGLTVVTGTVHESNFRDRLAFDTGRAFVLTIAANGRGVITFDG